MNKYLSVGVVLFVLLAFAEWFPFGEPTRWLLVFILGFQLSVMWDRQMEQDRG